MHALLLLLLLLVSPLEARQAATPPVDPALIQRYIDADPDTRKAMASTPEVDNTAFRQALSAASLAHSKQGRVQEAIRGFNALIDLNRMLGAARSQASAMISLSSVYGQIADYAEAARLLNGVLAIAVSPADDDLIAAASNNLGIVFRRRGQYAEALETFERALALNEAGKREDMTARTLNNIGIIHQFRGDFQRAIDYYLRSLEIKERLGLLDDVITTIGNIGSVYSLQGNNARAIEYFQRALGIAEKNGIVRHQLIMLSNLGRAMLESGNLDDAEVRLRQALPLAEKGGYAEQIGTTLNTLGAVEARRRNWDRALEHLQRAQAIFERSGDPAGVGFSLLARGQIEIDRGRPAAGVELARQAAGSFEAGGRTLALVDAEVVAGDALIALRRWPEAIAAFERAIAVNEQSLARVAGGAEDRLRYFETGAKAHSGLTEAYAAAGRASEALAAAERGRSRTLLDMLAAGRPGEQELSGADRDRVIELDTALSALNERLAADQARARAGVKPDAALAAEAARVRKLRDEFYLGLDARHPRLRFARGSAPVSNERDLADALPPKSALVEFVIGPRAAWSILLAPRAGRAPRLIVRQVPVPAPRLVAMAAEFTKQISNRDLAFSANARALYDALFGPIDAELTGIEHLIVVPHGGLWSMPFQALQTPRSRYLIEEKAIGYAPSASALRALQSRQRPQNAEPRVIAFGDPQLMDKRLAALPNAGREARELATVYGSARTTVATGGDASETRFRQLAPGADILHIATHGVIDNTSPLFSHVMLAGSGTARQADGRVEGHELINMQLGAELVVLSACETALGRISSGEGVVGLSWALFAAGASTTAVSQWPVDSASTTELMSAFHRERRRLKLAAAPAATTHAMRAAQLRTLAKPESRHPFYWAGFVVIGVP
jgi:CHAT domain-containing protein/Tfp pilus assembly protein PilF